MWFKTIFRNKDERRRTKDERRSSLRPSSFALRQPDQPLFDEAFLRRMERLSLQAQRSLRGNPASGEHPSNQRLPTSIFSDHRPYSSGDDLRYVDWNAYARHDTVLLKLGEAEQDVNVHLLIDASRSMAWGQPAKLQAAQRLAGALGYLALAHSDRLLVAPFGSSALRPFGPAQGKGQLLSMLRYIEAMQPQPTTDLNRVLREHARTYTRGGMLVLCSDLLAADGLAEGLSALAPPRWQVLVLHLLDQRELRPELLGPLELEDSESGRRMPLTLDAETLAAYRRNLARWQENLATTCARGGATYAQVITNWQIEQKVVPYLRVRRLLA
jgi:uncharacterized protein (DUF58 family)